MKKVIVTGANGFIGRHLLKILLEKNLEVYAVVRRIIPMPELKTYYYEKIHWVTGDLYLNYKAILHSLKQANSCSGGYDCLYHLAWNGVCSLDKNNYEEQIKNIVIGRNVIEICKSVDCKRFINLGTVGEYVSLDGLINEKWVPSPRDLYGAVKVAVRNLITVQGILDGIDVINTILCSTYGEFREGDNVISYTIKTLLAEEVPQYGHLRQMWDFLYVADVAKALWMIGEKGHGGKTYSIGSGTYRYLYEYIETIRDMIDPALPLGIGNLGNKYEKVLNSCVDTFELQKDTGFVPEHSFEEGIARTICYFREGIK